MVNKSKIPVIPEPDTKPLPHTKGDKPFDPFNKRKRKKKSKRKYVSNPETKKYSYEYLYPEIYRGKRPGQYTIEKYQDPKTMSDMQMHRVHDYPHETVHLSGDDTGALVVEKSTKHPYRKMESGAKKRLSRKKGGSVNRKAYANGGSVRAARF